MIPSIKENPCGLHRRYIIQKADGEPVDPRAVYFVLRLDGFGDDPAHIQACRAAAKTYVEEIERLRVPWLQRMSQELKRLVEAFESGQM
jgi:hypothetical protein